MMARGRVRINLSFAMVSFMNERVKFNGCPEQNINKQGTS